MANYLSITGTHSPIPQVAQTLRPHRLRPHHPHHLHPQHLVCEHKYVHNAGGLTGRQICWHVGRPLGKKALKSTEPMLCMLRYTIQSLPCHVKPIDGHCAYDATTVYGSIVF